MGSEPGDYVILPWTVVRRLGLPDHLWLTYELIRSVAHGHDGIHTPATARRDLAKLGGVAMRTFDRHLHDLRERGLVRSEPDRVGQSLVLVPLGVPEPRSRRIGPAVV